VWHAADGTSSFQTAGVHADPPPVWYAGQPPAVRLQQIIVSGDAGGTVAGGLSPAVARAAVLVLPALLRSFTAVVRGEVMQLDDVCYRGGGNGMVGPCLILTAGRFLLPSPGVVDVAAGGGAQTDRLWDEEDDGSWGEERGPYGGMGGAARLARDILGNLTARPAVPLHVPGTAETRGKLDRGLVAAGLMRGGRSVTGLVVNVALRPDLNEQQREAVAGFLGAFAAHLATNGTVPRMQIHVAPGATTYLWTEATARLNAETWFIALAYVLCFVYIHFSVSNFVAVKSKIGLAMTSVSIIVASMSCASGICQVREGRRTLLSAT